MALSIIIRSPYTPYSIYLRETICSGFSDQPFAKAHGFCLTEAHEAISRTWGGCGGMVGKSFALYAHIRHTAGYNAYETLNPKP